MGLGFTKETLWETRVDATPMTGVAVKVMNLSYSLGETHYFLYIYIYICTHIMVNQFVLGRPRYLLCIPILW